MYDYVLTVYYLSGYQCTKLLSLTSVFDHSGGKGTINTGIIIIIIVMNQQGQIWWNANDTIKPHSTSLFKYIII